MYYDPETGLQIVLPEGWRGIGFSGFVIVNPNGMPLAFDSSATMLISVINITSVGETSKTVMELVKSQNITNQSPPESNIECNTEKSYIELNDMVVMHAITECQDPTDPSSYSKSNIYNAAKKGTLLSVALTSNSAQSYEEYVDEFEQSIKTLKVRDAIDHRIVWSEPFGLKSETYDIEANGTKIDVKLESNSNISNFVFSEDQKRMSFTVEGEDGTPGLVIVPISRLLEGPQV